MSIVQIIFCKLRSFSGNAVPAKCSCFRYLTYTEWTTLYGGKRSGTAVEEDTTFKRLPYDHCCLCLQPFDDPYCDVDGNVFELQAVTEFVKKFKINPVTGTVCNNYY